MRRVLLALILLLFTAPESQAQGVLPQGVGLYRFGYRSFSTQSEKFGQDGERLSLGEPFNKDFTGPGLLRGNGGKDLSRLASELQKYDAENKSADSLLNQLRLGTLTGKVAATISAKILGLGYGVTPRITAYAGIPYVHARVRTSLQFDGDNNAAAIKNELGGAAFQELQDGLTRAANLSTADIEQGIRDKGYAPIDEWERDGLGDAQVGALYQLAGMRLDTGFFRVILDSGLSLPTGYVEDPDILTDVSFGLGTYALTERVLPNMQWQYASVGGEAAYTLPLTAKKNVRVPEGEESLTESDRKTRANYRPGQSYLLATDFGFRWTWVRSNLRLGVRNKFGDHYSGSLDGNYGKLSQSTDTRQTFSEIGIGADTTGLYNKQRFPLPAIVNVSAHLPLDGKNSNDDRYYELTITSFFKVPGAGRDSR